MVELLKKTLLPRKLEEALEVVLVVLEEKVEEAVEAVVAVEAVAVSLTGTRKLARSECDCLLDLQSC